MKLEKFKIERFKNNGESLKPVRIKQGIFILPHTKKQEGFIYYPGTLIPNTHFMEIRRYDKYNQLKGCCPPWTNPETIEINKELLNTENIYDKLQKARENNDVEQIEFLSRPLVTWLCPQTLTKKAIYPQDVTVLNRNNKSDYVYENLDRFEKAIEELQKIYKKEYIDTERGIAALINLLSAKFSFRVGNQTKKKCTGIGITTLRPKNIKVDEKNRIHFRFKGKKGMNWHKVFDPENDIEKLMHKGIIALKNKNKEFLFYNGMRVDSGVVNDLFREVMKVKDNEREYLSFHSWRHRLASQLFIKELAELNLRRKLKRIEKSKRTTNKKLLKAKLLHKSINKIFKKVAKTLNDTSGIVKAVYSGGKIFKDFYNSHGIEFDDKKRTFDKEEI